MDSKNKNITRKNFFKVTGAAGVILTSMAAGGTSCTTGGDKIGAFAQKVNELVVQMTLEEKVSNCIDLVI